MRRSPIIGAACAAAFAVHAAPSQAACAIPPVKWRSYSYTPYTQASVQAGAALPEPGTVPTCNDLIIDGHVPPPSVQNVTVAQVQGVSPSIAITYGSYVYVSASSFPALASHPLHAVLNVGRGPALTGPSCQIKGPAVFKDGAMYVNGARIFVEPDTKVEPQRHGTGFVPPGMTVRVGGRACEKRDGVVLITARRIARA